MGERSMAGDIKYTGQKLLSTVHTHAPPPFFHHCWPCLGWTTTLPSPLHHPYASSGSRMKTRLFSRSSPDIRNCPWSYFPHHRTLNCFCHTPCAMTDCVLDRLKASACGGRASHHHVITCNSLHNVYMLKLFDYIETSGQVAAFGTHTCLNQPRGKRYCFCGCIYCSFYCIRINRLIFS